MIEVTPYIDDRVYRSLGAAGPSKLFGGFEHGYANAFDAFAPSECNQMQTSNPSSIASHSPRSDLMSLDPSSPASEAMATLAGSNSQDSLYPYEQLPWAVPFHANHIPHTYPANSFGPQGYQCLSTAQHDRDPQDMTLPIFPFLGEHSPVFFNYADNAYGIPRTCQTGNEYFPACSPVGYMPDDVSSILQHPTAGLLLPEMPIHNSSTTMHCTAGLPFRRASDESARLMSDGHLQTSMSCPEMHMAYHPMPQCKASTRHACDIGDCTKSYLRREHLNRHKRVIHRVGGDQSYYECPAEGCTKSFLGRIDNFKDHLKIHKKGKSPRTPYDKSAADLYDALCSKDKMR